MRLQVHLDPKFEAHCYGKKIYFLDYIVAIVLIGILYCTDGNMITLNLRSIFAATALEVHQIISKLLIVSRAHS